MSYLRYLRLKNIIFQKRIQYNQQSQHPTDLHDFIPCFNKIIFIKKNIFEDTKKRGLETKPLFCIISID